MTKESLVQAFIIKLQYKQSFKNRRKILQEESIRSKLYKIRYATVLECLRESIKSNNATILDAGCGDGVFISEALCQFPQIIGLDLSIKSLFYIKEKQKEIQHVPLVQGDIENLPFKSNTLPSIVCIETLEHLVEIEKGLKEMHRSLCPNGILIATVPSALNLRNINIVGESSFFRGLMRTLRSMRKGYVVHTWKDEQDLEFPHKVYWKWKIKRIIEECGFVVQAIKNTPLVISPSNNSLAERIINKITPNQLGELFIVCAIKKSFKPFCMNCT